MIILLSIELPVNFKLVRFVELLTVEQRREAVVHGTQRDLPLSHPRPSCPIHETKLLEYYCETCSVMICGQCMLNDHRIHGTVKYANEVLDSHVQELREILPDAVSAIVSGEDMLQDLKSETVTLNDEFSESSLVVKSYFETLHNILWEKENDIMNVMKSRAKKKERRLLKRMKALNQAVEAMKKSKMTLEDALDNRSSEIGILLEEKQLRARVLAGRRLVEDETLDCRSFVGGFSNFPKFNPDPSLEGKCRSISYSLDSPVQKRSHTSLPKVGGLDLGVPPETRRRASAFISYDKETTAQRRNKRLSGHDFHKLTPPLSPLSVVADQLKSPKTLTIVDPVGEIETKSLIGSNNHVTAYPYGVCCTNQPEGALLVTDIKHHLFRIMTSTGKCLETIGTEGNGDGQFTKPVAIAVDSLGNILVLDGKNPGRLQKFSNAGIYVLAIIS